MSVNQPAGEQIYAGGNHRLRQKVSECFDAIAASIGANREIVSRTMTKLARRDILRTARQRIELLNPDALSAIL